MVSNILGMMAGGKHISDILDAYPELSREDVEAALEYATRLVDEHRVVRQG
jgi:uncharacterized protein (DUF433 family)